MSVFDLRKYAPSYMGGPRMSILLDACSLAFDAMAARFDDGRRASSVADCEPEVIPYHATDRGIRLYPTEPLASKRNRLASWHQLHQRRGTCRGALEHVQPYFLPGALPVCQVVHTSANGITTWHKRDGAGVYTCRTGAVWNWDGHWSRWSRQWGIVDCSGGYPFSSHKWGEVGLKWGAPDLLWGASIAGPQAADLPAIFRDWKSAHSRYEYIILDFGGHFGPDMASPPAGDWDYLDNRWPGAAYMKGY